MIKQVLDYNHYTLTVSLPKRNDACQYCPIVQIDHARDMRVCRMTGEILPNWKARRGDDCPLIENVNYFEGGTK